MANVQLVLVLNKMDRLITELRLSPSDSFLHIQKIIEQVNAVVARIGMDIVVREETRKYEVGTVF
jgi:ribosome assembly protein 1